MDIQTIALRGLEQSQARLDQAAGRIASIGDASPDGTNVDSVDLSAESVALLSAKNSVELNVSGMKAADRMQASLINLLG